jgi:hypothetical protein
MACIGQRLQQAERDQDSLQARHPALHSAHLSVLQLLLCCNAQLLGVTHSPQWVLHTAVLSFLDAPGEAGNAASKNTPLTPRPQLL